MQRFIHPKKQPHNRRGPARWTLWEIALIALSVLLIIFPLYAEAYSWLNPLVAPAAPRAQTEPSPASVASPQPAEPSPASAPAAPSPASAASPQPAEPSPVSAPAEPSPASQPAAPSAAVGVPAPPATAQPAEPSPVKPSDADLQRVTSTTGPTPAGGTATSVPPTDTAVPGTATTIPPTGTTAAGTATTIPPTDTTVAGTPTTVPPTGTTAPGTATTVPPTATAGAPTIAPTAGPSPTPTATLTPLPNEPPLRLDKNASTSSVQPGEKFNYTIGVFSNKLSASTIQVRDSINTSLDVLGASATNGSCSIASNVVSCQVTAQNNQPVTINISVQVHSAVPAGTRITNQASAQDDRNSTAASDQVVVDVSGSSGIQPTVGPTSTRGPTSTPGGPTSTPGGPVVTSVPVAPTNTPKPGGSSGGSNGGSSGGSSGGSDSHSDQQGTPALPPLPPLPQPGAVLPPTPRVGSVRPAAGQAAGPVSRPIPTEIPATATVVPTADPGAFFRMASDWGSTFTGQEINYVIAFRNTRTDAAMNNVVITSALPENLQILDDKADRGDPQLQGNTLTWTATTLQPGEGVEIAVRAKIKDQVDVGTRLVSQAEATFDGLALPLRSNVVTVLIVGSDLGPVAASIPNVGGTVTPTASATSTTGPATDTPTSAPTDLPTDAPTNAPAAAGVAAISPAVSPAASPATSPTVAPLPATSAGFPISGFLLLGLTMLLRTVRIHRSQTRI